MSLLLFVLILVGSVVAGLALSIGFQSGVGTRVFGLPLAAGAAGWLWSAISIPADRCHTGDGHSSVIALVLLGLIVFAPALGVAWQARHTQPVLLRILAPALTLLLSIVLVLIGTQAWWYGHDCYD